VQISDIEDRDLPRILALNENNVPEVGPLDTDRLKFLLGESKIALKVTVDDSIAGFCLVLGPGSSYESVNYRWFVAHHPRAMYLDRVAFDRSSQGLGLGSALYDTVDQIIRNDYPEATALALEVNVNPPNEPSLRFHDRLGFVEVGRQFAKGIEVSLMTRDM
jgi:uncharacterized protein